MSNESVPSRQSAIEAGEALLEILRTHIDLVAGGTGSDDEAEEVDRRLWEAVGEYGDALDDLYDEAEEPDEASGADELTFTVRTRYDYTVSDEKALLSRAGGIGALVGELLQKAGKPLPAFEIDALETGSGLVTVHLNDEPLTADDFEAAEEPTDLLLVAPNETLTFVLDEPVYESRAEAEAAAKKD
ncbi:hypothetical protein [Homoserinimonas hongtaonis]|uniref:Uncharacterized protein n=1 Tax=Homoserinimonas hongtaonis TaxID=2079791 RepID=A0A2U1T2C8_9MICO|nr:hypothetical protein [Salinibacterium hongtaonis]PWB98000.1 hypothetical protein DF220_09295 [Salinibacterium hongtaonis]